MKCPECVKTGEKSIVYGGEGGFSTLMCAESFYDEEGRHHRHDPNWHTEGYRCSKGHSWSQSTMKRCGVEECEWNKRALFEMAMDAPAAMSPITVVAADTHNAYVCRGTIIDAAARTASVGTSGFIQPPLSAPECARTPCIPDTDTARAD